MTQTCKIKMISMESLGILAWVYVGEIRHVQNKKNSSTPPNAHYCKTGFDSDRNVSISLKIIKK